MVTLKQLRYFAALARHRHFGRAAAECHVSQPALSLQIQELESVLGRTLIERRRNAVALTSLGENVLERAQRILGETRDLVDYARHSGEPLAGPLHLGVIPSVAPYLLPAALPRLHRLFPALELRLRETQTDTLLAELEDGRLDVLLLSLPVETAGVEVLPLFEDAFYLALPGDRAPGIAARKAMAGENLLLLEEGHCLRDQALAFCRSQGNEARRQYGASSLATIMQMVANGLGATLLPAMAVAIEARPDMAVTIAAFDAPAPSRSIGLAWRRTSPRKAEFVSLGRVLGEPPPVPLRAAP